MAPLAPGVTLVDLNDRRVSPMMNQPDDRWNLGESPHGRDRGGALEPDPLPDNAVPNFEAQLPSGGWQPYPQPHPDLVHFIGSFRPAGGLMLGDDPLASFEIVAPGTLQPGDKVVVVLLTRPTSGASGAESDYAPHVYPGNPAYYDLMANGPGGFHVDVVGRYIGMSVPFKLVAVQHVPPTSYRPVWGELQRLRQVRKVAKHLLTQPPFSLNESDLAYYVECGSFGGFTAPMAALFWPKEFHAATGYAFSGALRAMQSDFDSLVFFTSLLGVGSSGAGYTMRDALEFPMWCAQEGTDFASASFTNRWSRGHVQRPTYFVIGDVDFVTHGTDWIQTLKVGSPPNPLVQPLDGHEAKMNVFGRQVEVLWSVMTKAGHSEPRFNVFTVRGLSTPVRTSDSSLIFDVMVQKAYEELFRPAVLPIDDPQLGRKLTNQSALPSVDPSFPALTHAGNRTYNHGSMPSLLTANPSFQRYGQGTWLGANESLVVATLPNDDRASVFVGSADGYVTRLRMEGRPVANPVISPLVEKARTKKIVNGQLQPYALGHGTWGLVVGDVLGLTGKLQAVVASYDKIAIFDATSLDLVSEVTLPGWEYTHPRKLQLADLLDGNAKEIVFRTLHGHLVIMDQNLAIRYEHQEGGIIDLVVGPAPTPRGTTWLKRPIYLLSARGHVVRLEIDTSIDNLNSGILAGASPLQYGGLRDLDLIPFGNQEVLAALCILHPPETNAVRFFSPGDCSLIGGFGNVVLPPPPPEEGFPPTSLLYANPSGDQEPSMAYVTHPGGDRYAISCNGALSVWDGSEWLGNKLLGSFRPADGYACVQAGNIDPTRPGDEVVVSTEAGRVVWFTLDDLTTPGPVIDTPDYVRSSARFAYDPTDARTYEHRCNLSLAATWSMAAVPASGSTPGKLHAIDQAGTWWEVDHQGKPTWVRDLLGSSYVIATTTWGLHAAGATDIAPGMGGAAEREWETIRLASSPPWVHLRSRPYVPKTDNVYGQWWLASLVLDPPLPPLDARAVTNFLAGYWVLPLGGATYVDSSTGLRWCAWWQSYGAYTNLIQRATYTVSGGVATVLDVWGSTQGVVGGGAPPPRWPPSAPGFLNPLDSEVARVTPMRMRGIAIGKVLYGRSMPQVVAANSGGQILLLDGNDGRVISPVSGGLPEEAPDFGLGGMALAVADLTGDGYDDIVFAPLYNPIPWYQGTGQAPTLRSHIVVLKSNATGDGLDPVPVSTVPVAGSVPADGFIGYGACGLAILDLPTTPPITKAIVVTTMNGELAVFTQSNGIINPTPLYRTIVEGSLGAFSSIVLADLEPDPASKPELYIAGSSGIARFDFP